MKITIKNLRGGNIWLGEATSTLVAVELAAVPTTPTTPAAAPVVVVVPVA